MKNRLKRIICLHTFIDGVIHSRSCIIPGFAHHYSAFRFFKATPIELWRSAVKRIICLHTFIERVIHSMSCTMLGFAQVFLRLVSSYFQSTFIEWSRHVLERVVTTRSSRDESSTFCTLRHPLVLLPVSTISFPPATRLPVSRVVSALRRLESMRVYWTWMNIHMYPYFLQIIRFKYWWPTFMV